MPDWERAARTFGEYLLSIQKGKRKLVYDRVRGNCPLPDHEDKHPSFSYWITHDCWACSCGCGKGSDLRKRLGYKDSFEGDTKEVEIYSYGKNRKVKFRKAEGKQGTWEHETPQGWEPNSQGELHAFGISEIGDAELVCLSESESDRNSLVKLGFPSIATPHGSSQPIREDDASHLEGKRVALMEHQDENLAGAKWSAKCLPVLRKAKARPFIVVPPKPHKDIRDYIKTGVGQKEISLLIQGAWLKRPGFVKASSLFETISEKVEYAINPIFPKGELIQLHGAPKQGKSTFSLACALQLAGGKWEAGEFSIERPHRVGYLSYEDNKRRLKGRSIEFSRGFGWSGAIPEEFHLWSVRDPLLWLDQNAMGSEVVLSIIESKIEVLFIDTFSYTHSSDENSATEMKLIMAQLIDLCQILNLTVVYIHHSRKPSSGGDQAKTSERGRGSTAISAAPDVILDWGDRVADNVTELQMESKEDDAKTWHVHYKKELDEMLQKRIRWEIEPTKKPRKIDQESELQSIVEELTTVHPGGFNRYHFGEAIGRSKSTTIECLNMLCSKGIIMKSTLGGGPGKVTVYKLPPKENGDSVQKSGI